MSTENSSGMSGTKASDHVVVSQALYEYVLDMGTNQAITPAQKAIMAKTAAHPRARMMGSPDEARLFQVLLKLIGARTAVEVGVFTGYTTLAMAEALPDDGKVVALDVAEEFVSIGRPVWAEAGVAHKIDVRIAPALDSLKELAAEVAEGKREKFDFAFIDADKVNYPAYFTALLDLVRSNGIIAIDNVMWHGSVIDPSKNDSDTEAIRTINNMVKHEPRVDIVMLAIADGVTLARVK